MLDPTALFTWEAHVDQRTVRVRTLVVTLGNYVDAGHVQRQLNDHVMGRLPNRLIGRFDADQVLDYTGRRPAIVFDRDHFSRYEKPEITLHLVTDSDGTDVAWLRGPEPNFQWERMAAAVVHVAEQLNVEQTVLVQTMPAPTPHTRPVPVTRYGSEEGAGDGEPILGTFQISASFGALLTLRLGEAGHPVLGLLGHVPHYAAETDYPAAALAMLDVLREATSLALPREGFDLASAAVRAQLDQAVGGSEELTALVHALEQQYDQMMEQHRLRADSGQVLPSADEIGHQFEEYLAGLSGEGGDAEDTPPADQN